jgi:transposase-like protein
MATSIGQAEVLAGLRPDDRIILNPLVNGRDRHDAEVETRQVKYLNNVVEQDHRAIKRQVPPVMGFKFFWSAAATLTGIELMHMIRKGQMKATGRLRPPQQFYALAN